MIDTLPHVCFENETATTQATAVPQISCMSCDQAERRLAEEVERVANYLDPSTEAKLTRVAEQELIQNQVRLNAAHNATMAQKHCGIAGHESSHGGGWDWGAPPLIRQSQSYRHSYST